MVSRTASIRWMPYMPSAGAQRYFLTSGVPEEKSESSKRGARLDHADAVALLGQPERGDRAAEPGADDQDVEVELLAHARPSFFISRRLAVIILA